MPPMMIGAGAMAADGPMAADGADADGLAGWVRIPGSRSRAAGPRARAEGSRAPAGAGGARSRVVALRAGQQRDLRRPLGPRRHLLHASGRSQGPARGRGALLEVVRAEPARAARRRARDDRRADQGLSEQPLPQGGQGARGRGPRPGRAARAARGTGRRGAEAHRDQRARPQRSRRRPCRCSRNSSPARRRHG